MNAPKPESPQEAGARPDIGKGPFTVDKGPPELGFVAIRDSTGAPFAYVNLADCAGADAAAAKARATRVAEALNRNVTLRDALLNARGIIQSERDTTVECATTPPEHDLATLDDQTRPHVEAYDQALADIDEALR